MTALGALRTWRSLLCAGIVCLIFPISASAAADALQALRQRISNLSGSEQRCEQAERATLKARQDAIGKPYRSPEERTEAWQKLDSDLEAQRFCLQRTDADISNTLAELEIECQKRSGAPGPQREEALSCAQSAHDQRMIRQQLRAVEVRQWSCEEQAQKTRE